MREIVHHTVTGLLETTVESGPDGFTVARAPGLLAPPWKMPNAESLQAVTGHVAPGVTWAPPVEDTHGRRSFVVPGVGSVARLALSGMNRQAITQMLRPVVSALSSLNERPATNNRPPTPVLRLQGWLRDGSGAGHAGEVYNILTTTLSSDDMQLLCSNVDALAEGRVHAQNLLLGSAGASAVYPDPSGDGATVLVDEVCAGPPGWDVGWLLGEQIELLLSAPGAEVKPPRLTADPVVAELLVEAPDTLDSIGYFAGLRWLTHMHDYAAYVGWSDDLPRGVRAACRFLTDPLNALHRPEVLIS